jgi:hypothetical protein
MNGCVGYKGPCGCVRCLVPSKQFNDTTTSWPERDSELAAKVISNALLPRATYDASLPTPHELGLRPVKVCLSVSCDYKLNYLPECLS